MHKSRCLQAYVSAVAIKFNASRQQGNVFFVQTRCLARFTSERALDEFMEQFFICQVGVFLNWSSHSNRFIYRFSQNSYADYRIEASEYIIGQLKDKADIRGSLLCVLNGIVFFISYKK